MLDVIRELLAQYNTQRALWINVHGNDKGFDAWFTNQVVKT